MPGTDTWYHNPPALNELHYIHKKLNNPRTDRRNRVCLCTKSAHPL